MSETPFHSLSSTNDWAKARSHSEDRPILVFKHSSACPVSGKANREMQELAEADDLPIYKLVVQESREVSDDIANTLNIRHETPQAILLDGGDPVFTTSHFDVTAETLREAIRSGSSASN